MKGVVRSGKTLLMCPTTSRPVIRTAASLASGLLIVACLHSDLCALGPDTLWTRTCGGMSAECGNFVEQTSDRGYISVGSTKSFGSGKDDVYLIRMNHDGDTLWTATYGGLKHDSGSCVRQTKDGGFVIVGETLSFGSGNKDIYLVRVDEMGDTVWTRTYGGPSHEIGRAILEIGDEGFLIAGYRRCPGRDGAIYLIRTDSRGDTTWTRSYGGHTFDDSYCIEPTSDGGYGPSPFKLIRTKCEF